MKIKNGFPKFDQEIHEKLLKDGWKELKEPKSLMSSVALSIPFMIINFLIGMWIMDISTSRIATDQKIITIDVIYAAPLIILTSVESTAKCRVKSNATIQNNSILEDGRDTSVATI